MAWFRGVRTKNRGDDQRKRSGPKAGFQRKTGAKPSLEVLEDRSLPSIAAGPIINPANGHTYYLLTTSNWTAAEVEAVSLGGHLATINDAAEDAWVFNTFSNPSQYGLWIGLNDVASPGAFVWTSGEPVGYTNWHPGQPDGIGREERYGMIFVNPMSAHQPGKWNNFRNTALEGDTFGGVLQGVVEVTTTPDIAATSLVWNTAQSGVDFGYRVSGADLTQTTTAALYWARGPSFNDRIGGPVYDTPIERQQGDYGPFYVPNSVLGTPPAGATHLLLVVDPPTAGSPNGIIAESDETNNVLALGIPDILIHSVTTHDSRSVTIDYEVLHATLDRLHLRVYRSEGVLIDSDDPVLGESTTVSGAIGRRSITLPLAQALRIDPSQPFVIVKADPDGSLIETAETNNEGFFRKYVLGVVTHGFTIPGPFFPDWVNQVANRVQASPGQIGYDAAFPYFWVADSRLRVSGRTEFHGQRLADVVRGEALRLANRPEFVLNRDVVDVHFIGHSRGAVVISQALQSLVSDPGPEALSAGFKKMTMLDPHPAHNHLLDRQYSVMPGPFGRAAETALVIFQTLANDPEVYVPRNVHESEVFFQHTPWFAASGIERVLNLWGEVPVLDLSGQGVRRRDLTAAGMSHTRVPEWYLANIVPSLWRGESF